MIRPLFVTSLMLVLVLTACGAGESGTQAAPSPAAASKAAAAEPSTAPSAAPLSEAAGAEASAATEGYAEASSTLDVGAAIDLAASAVAEASTANAAAGPSDDGCPAALTATKPERASLAATWNPQGTISVRGELDVPADSTIMMFTYQDGTEVGWAQFGSFGIIEAGTPFDQTSTIPQADDIIYGEMAKEHPYQPGSPVYVGLIAMRGDVSIDDMSDPAKRDAALLARVRLPVGGDAPAEITLP